MTAFLATGGRVLTPASRDATALAHENGLIVWAGSDAPGPALFPGAEQVDLEGDWVAPAFVECLPGDLDLTAAAMSGVSGAGLSTTVQPAASAGPILAKLIWLGKFHGVMAPTTPTASRRVERLERTPMISDSPSSVTHS